MTKVVKILLLLFSVKEIVCHDFCAHAHLRNNGKNKEEKRLLTMLYRTLFLVAFCITLLTQKGFFFSQLKMIPPKSRCENRRENCFILY
jgi:hypothetical protein